MLPNCNFKFFITECQSCCASPINMHAVDCVLSASGREVLLGQPLQVLDQIAVTGDCRHLGALCEEAEPSAAPGGPLRTVSLPGCSAHPRGPVLASQVLTAQIFKGRPTIPSQVPSRSWASTGLACTISQKFHLSALMFPTL